MIAPSPRAQPADLKVGCRCGHASSSTLTLPLFTSSSASSPVPSSSPSSPTLRSRRRSSGAIVRLIRRRMVQIILALSIPLLGLLLINERHQHSARRNLWAAEKQSRPIELHELGRKSVDLGELRKEYGEKRKEELFASLGKRGGNRWSWFGGDVAWTMVHEERLRREVTDTWPAWWGNVDVVGRSPWDHVPAPLTGDKKRVLFLTDYVDYLERMNTHTYEIVDAALRHPHLNVDVWGPGWAEWDASVPLSVNVKRRQHRVSQLNTRKAAYRAEVEKEMDSREMEKRRDERGRWWSLGAEVMAKVRAGILDAFGSQVVREGERPEWEAKDGCGEMRYDLVWTISDIFKQDDPLVDALDCGSLLVQQLGDCHELRCLSEWYPQANNITLTKYAFELKEVFDYERVKGMFPSWELGIFGHSPDTANEWDFHPVPWAKKTSEATMFGFDGSFYPIRTTITDYLYDHADSLIIRHEHPGYLIEVPDSAREEPLETYELNHPYYQTHQLLREDFAKGMRQAKICIFDASLERKMIRKYAQAFLSGCVVAADLPTEHEEVLERFTIPLKPTWPIERIHQELELYLSQPEKLHQMALDALVYARTHLTTTAKISQVLRMVDQHRAGFRGYDYPYSFSSRCRSYWSGEAHRPPWCSAGLGPRGLEE